MATPHPHKLEKNHRNGKKYKISSNRTHRFDLSRDADDVIITAVDVVDPTYAGTMAK